MSVPLILAAIWAVIATIVAMLPMRLQYAPGIVLLILAPVLIGFMSYTHGVLIGLIGLAGFVSMFRRPLRYFWCRFTSPKQETSR